MSLHACGVHIRYACGDSEQGEDVNSGYNPRQWFWNVPKFRGVRVIVRHEQSMCISR